MYNQIWSKNNFKDIQMKKGILYIMTTAVSGLIKIGQTDIKNYKERMRHLESNGYYNVVGLKRAFAVEVNDYIEKEKLLKEIFNKHQVGQSELFALDVDLVKQLLLAFDGKVTYPEKTQKDKEFEKITKIRTQGKKFSFYKKGLKNGDIIKKSPLLNFYNCRNAMSELLDVTSNFGFINVTRDDDGIIRYIAPLFYYKDAYYPNLTTLIALKYLNIDPDSIYVNKDTLVLNDKYKIPLNPDGRAIINWYGKEGTFEHISLWQVDDAINNNDIKFLKEKFENKVIYIGTTVTALADIKSTPVSFMYPGVETHATFLNNILDNNFITHFSFKADLIISAILCFLIGICVLRIESVTYSVIFSILIISVYLFITVLLMDFFNIWLGIVLPVLSAVLIFIAAYIAKYLLKSKDYEHTYKLAVTDGLTEMYNHRYFQEQMIMNVGNVSRYGGNFSLILIDIDFFKKFNDKHGHQSGDAVLRQVAQTIKKNIRTCDIPCRYGGEEMSIILANTAKEDAITVAKKVWSAIRERKFELADGNWANVTISVGVATMPDNGKNPQELIEYADKCLYKAKQNGRDQVVSEID